MLFAAVVGRAIRVDQKTLLLFSQTLEGVLSLMETKMTLCIQNLQVFEVFSEHAEYFSLCNSNYNESACTKMEWFATSNVEGLIFDTGMNML